MDQPQNSNTFNNISTKDMVIMCKEHIKEIGSIIDHIDLREVSEGSVNIFIKGLRNSYDILENLERKKDIDTYMRSIDALRNIIHDTIAELQIIGYTLEERHMLDITGKVESMRLVNKSLYSCRMYLKEALRAFII